MARVVRDLEQLGVPSGEISLVANRHVSEQSANVDDASATASGAGIGAAVGGGAGLGLMAIPGLGPDVAVGWLASTLIGAATGTAAGSLVGLLVDAGTSEPDAHVFSETARRGGTLVTARTSLPVTLPPERYPLVC